MISKDYFEGFPPKTYSVVRHELNEFFKKNWDLDEDYKQEIEHKLIIKLLDNRDQIKGARFPDEYVRKICQNYFNDEISKKIRKDSREIHEDSENFKDMDSFSCSEEAPSKGLKIEELPFEQLESLYNEKFPPEFRLGVDNILDMILIIRSIKDVFNKEINIEWATSLELLSALLKFRKKMRSILRPSILAKREAAKKYPKMLAFYDWAQKVCDKAEHEKISEKEFWPFFGQLIPQIIDKEKGIIGYRLANLEELPEDCPYYFGSCEEFNLEIPELNFLAKLNELIRLCKRWVNLKQNIAFNYPWFEPYYFSFLGIEDLSSDYFLFIKKLKVRPCQLLFDVLKKFPEIKKGSSYSNLERIKFIIWYLKQRHKSDEYSYIFEPIKKPDDIEKLRQYHYRHNSRPYKKLIKHIFENVIFLRYGFRIFSKHEEAEEPDIEIIS